MKSMAPIPLSASRLVRRPWLVLVLGLLVACSSGGGDDSGDAPAGATVAGSATKGTIDGGNATVSELGPGAVVGDQLAQVPVEDGAFTADLGAFQGAAIVEVASGTYTDEASGDVVDLAAQPVPLRSVAGGIEAGREVRAGVTPFTTIASELVLQSGTSCNDVDLLIADSLQRTARFFRGDPAAGTAVDLLDVTPADMTAPVDDPCSDSALLGAWNAGLSRLGLDRGVTAVAVLDALVQDLGDGVFDGRDRDGAEVVLGGDLLGTSFVTIGLADAIDRFLMSDANDSGFDLDSPGAACLRTDVTALMGLGMNAALLGPAALVFPAGQDPGPFVVDDEFDVSVGFMDLFGAASATLTLTVDPAVLEIVCGSTAPGSGVPPGRLSESGCDPGGGVLELDLAVGAPLAGGCGDLFTSTLRAVAPAEGTPIAVSEIDFRTAANTPLQVDPPAATARDVVENRAPVAVVSAPAMVMEEGQVVFDGSGSSDPDDDPLTYRWEQTSGPAFVIDDPMGQTTTATAPALDKEADAKFLLTVDDGRSADSEDSMMFTVKVVPENDAPMAVIASIDPVNEQTEVVLDGSASSDPNMDGLTYLWTQVSGTPVEIQDAMSPMAGFTAPVLVADAVLGFRLTVTDDHPMNPLAGMAEVEVMVWNINDDPVAVAGADPSPATSGEEVTLNGSESSDPNPGDVLTYQWMQTSGPPVELSDPTSSMPTFTAPVLEPEDPDVILVFELTVEDPHGAMHMDEVQVVVSAGSPRAVIAPVADPPEGAMVMLDGSGSFDPNDDPLTYAWMQTAGLPVMLDDSTIAKPKFTAPMLAPDASDEVLEFKLVVRDPGGLMDMASVQVTILRDNDPPVSVIKDVGQVFVGNVVALDGSMSFDPNPGDVLSFAWTQVSGPAVVLQDDDTAMPSFTSDAEGMVVLELKVTDSGGLMDTEQISIDVSVPPMITLTLGIQPKNGASVHTNVGTVTYVLMFDEDEFGRVLRNPVDPNSIDVTTLVASDFNIFTSDIGRVTIPLGYALGISGNQNLVQVKFTQKVAGEVDCLNDFDVLGGFDVTDVNGSPLDDVEPTCSVAGGE